MNKTILTEGDEGVQLIIREPRGKSSKTITLPAETRSPVHVVYGGADRFSADTPAKLGRLAVAAMENYAANFVEFAAAMRLAGSETLPTFPKAVADLEKRLKKDAEKVRQENYAAWFAWTVYSRTLEKLRTEAVEDFRIDFEDGYGIHSDEAEDADAKKAATQLAESFTARTITHFCGFRIRPLGKETAERAERTLKIFLDTLLKAAQGKLPPNFVVTLPKVAHPKEVKKLSRLLKKFERKNDLPVGGIGIELLIETPEAVIDKKGRIAIAALVKASGGRCTSLHVGAYDLTASLGISAVYQDIRHPACDLVRQIMLIASAGLGVRLSDSVTTQLPLPAHRGEKLSAEQAAENKRSVHRGWKVHFDNITHSMANGFYQSWDLHPNQLPARYAAVFAFFIGGAEAQGERLKRFVELAARAVTTGTVFDDAASAQGLLIFFAKALSCGALTAGEIEFLTGLTADEIRGGSFAEIVDRRQS